jgi:hypothetical protein
MSDVVIDEVTPTPASTDPKSAQNGLGLEAVLAAKPAKPSPPKDPVTGKFMKAGGPTTGESNAPKQSAQPAKDATTSKPPDIANLEKRLKDTRDFATQTKQENERLKERLKVLEAKMDGTYIEPPSPSPETVEELKLWQERVKVDNAHMIQQYGEEEVQRRIWDPQSPYMQLEKSDPLIAERMRRATRPVEEAWKIVERFEFEQKYGTEPDAIKAAIIAEYKQQLEQELTAELKAGRRTVDSVNTLSGIGGVPRSEAPRNPAGDVDLKRIFTNFQHGSQ